MFKTHYLILIFHVLLVSGMANAQTKYVFQKEKMSSPFTIIVYAEDSLKVANVIQSAFQKVDSLVAIFSDYEADSELNRLSQTSGTGKSVKVSSELFDVLELAQKASIHSEGAFDITVGPLVELWRKAMRERKVPDKTQIQRDLQAVNYAYIHLNKENRSVRLEKPHMKLDLGGIAKGYIAEAVLQFLIERGLPMTLIDAGGDIAIGDAPPHRKGWRIGVSIPGSHDFIQRNVILKNKSIATSGDTYQFIEIDGVRYSHIVNPQTGNAETMLRNVSVIANHGAEADWIASACSVLSSEEAFKLVENIPGVALFISEKQHSHIYKKGDPQFMKYFAE